MWESGRARRGAGSQRGAQGVACGRGRRAPAYDGAASRSSALRVQGSWPFPFESLSAKLFLSPVSSVPWNSGPGIGRRYSKSFAIPWRVVVLTRVGALYATPRARDALPHQPERAARSSLLRCWCLLVVVTPRCQCSQSPLRCSALRAVSGVTAALFAPRPVACAVRTVCQRICHAPAQCGLDAQSLSSLTGTAVPRGEATVGLCLRVQSREMRGAGTTSWPGRS